MMMRITAIHLHSAQPEALIDFYQRLLGIEPRWDYEETAVFALGDLILIIRQHSKVYGQNRYPERMFFDFEVADVRAEFDRILALGATAIQSPYGFAYDNQTVTFATLADPDGNYFQLRSSDAPVQDKSMGPG